MQPSLGAEANGLLSSSIKYKFKQRHQVGLGESSCWRSLEKSIGIQ